MNFDIQTFLNSSFLTLLPLFLGGAIFFNLFGENQIIIRRTAKWFMGLFTAYSLLFTLNFNSNTQFDFNSSLNFFNQTTLNFNLDLLSSITISIFCFITFICLIVAKSLITKQHKTFYSFALLFLSSFICTLTTNNISLFLSALMFETFCIYMLIANFSNKKTDTSLVFLNFAIILFLSVIFGALDTIFKANLASTNMSQILENIKNLPQIIQFLTSCVFFLFCTINLGVFPLHKPLVNTIKNLNTAGIFLPIGQALLAFCLFIKFNFLALFDIFWIAHSLICTIFITSTIILGLLALKQINLKEGLGYFYLSQNTIPLISICALSQIGINGGIFSIFSNAIIFLGLILYCAFAILKLKTEKLPLMGALLTKAPMLAIFGLFFTFAGVGIPLTCGFISKILCALGGFSSEAISQNVIWICIVILISSYILAGLFLIKIFSQIFLGTSNIQEKITDIPKHQFLALGLICLICTLFGIMPQIILEYISNYGELITSTFVF